MQGFFTDRPDRVAELERLVDEGKSFAEIAKIMGAPSRNVVLGKYQRTHGNRPHAGPDKPVEIRPCASTEEVAPIMEPSNQIVTYMTVSTRQCRFPIGDPLEEDFHLCGEAKKLNSPYCEEHHAVCYIPIKPYRKRVDHEGRKRA